MNLVLFFLKIDFHIHTPRLNIIFNKVITMFMAHCKEKKPDSKMSNITPQQLLCVGLFVYFLYYVIRLFC